MPKRDDIGTILLIGSGPIVIGQGCEFDYSGAQACKALRDEGYRVVLINSNPATIMTDPAMSDRTYIEPITPEAVRKILEKERDLGTPIDAVLPTLGGQTALNCACALFDDGTLDEFGVEMIGADRAVIHRAEDRQEFAGVCARAGLKTPESKTVTTLDEAEAFVETIGLPAIIRPAFTLGGWGGGIAYNRDEFRELVTRGIRASMIDQVQVDRSLIGWKEYELEVVRDKRDNCVIVCGIENIDAMGVHTGDSVTVAPILTLTDKEYQTLRDASLAIMREVGVETGGSNVQFAVNPSPAPPGGSGEPPFEFVVVEMNPRVSRSSALASKATGFPIAKIAAKLAIGYTLDELRNDITRTTSACFEPSIDYVVTKMPRWTFEKFPEADETLTTQMKSVGEAMAIGRTLKESLQKVIRSMDVKRFGLGLDRNDKWLAAMRAVDNAALRHDGGVIPRAPAGARTADGAPIEWPIDLDKLTRKLTVPSQGRLYYVRYALKMGWSVERVSELTKIDPFFIDQMAQLVEFEDELCAVASLNDVDRELMQRAKELGYADAQLANLYLGEITSASILRVRAHRESLGVRCVYKLVDTCAAEFEAVTPYYYSTYQPGHDRVLADGSVEHVAPEDELAERLSVGPVFNRPDSDHAESESRLETGSTKTEKVIILGGGPNRIGQGIEFDYCCVHAAYSAKELGFESVMINSNPETVSTDYDTSDLLFFEPLTLEDVLNVVERLNGTSRVSSRITDVVPSNEPRLTSRRAAMVRTLDQHNINRVAICLVAERGFSDGTDGFKYEFVSDDGRHWGAVFKETPDPTLVEIYERLEQDAVQHYMPDIYAGACRALGLTPGPVLGVIVQFGGQTPLNLAAGLDRAGVPLLGTSLDAIDRAEDRDRFDQLLTKLELKRPGSGIARSLDEAVTVASRVGYPVLVRPSYVLGGRGMEICPDEPALRHYITGALASSDLDDAPVLIDQFLDSAIELDVDVVADFGPPGGPVGPTGQIPRLESSGAARPEAGAPVESQPGRADRATEGQALVCAVMEHIEQAGVHSGDSTCFIPPQTLSNAMIERVRSTARALARELRVCGLMNVQMAIKDDEVYIIEVNPRASRTVPYVGKAKGVPWAAIAAKAMMGVSLADQHAREVPDAGYHAVKAPVFPFQKFPGVDFILGPEMRSTGEVMGVDASPPVAYLKAMLAAGTIFPNDGGVFVSVREQDKPAIVPVVRSLMAMGFEVFTTAGTGAELTRHGMRPTVLPKIQAGERPNVLDMMHDAKIGLVINTPTRTGWKTDEGRIRATAVRLGIPMITTATAAGAAVRAIEAQRAGVWGVNALQDLAPAVPAHA
ncbi:MAG: carbamoyl-phosphate synthase large subunit [Phycisphaerales bacterium]